MRRSGTKTNRVGTQPPSLFGPVVQAKPLYVCGMCGQTARYGASWPLTPSDQWFCRQHLPAGFLPQQRGVAA
jgi:hypothetical protein